MKSYTADAELALLLKSAAQAGERLLVKADGETYLLVVTSTTADDIWANYDPEKVNAAVERSASLGLHADLREIDQLIADIRAERDQAPRRAVR